MFEYRIFGQNVNFLTIFGQEKLDFEFSQVYHYAYTQENTMEIILEIFHPKLTTKFEVIRY